MTPTAGNVIQKKEQEKNLTKSLQKVTRVGNTKAQDT